jgi:large repetitive protein
MQKIVKQEFKHKLHPLFSRWCRYTSSAWLAQSRGRPRINHTEKKKEIKKILNLIILDTVKPTLKLQRWILLMMVIFISTTGVWAQVGTLTRTGDMTVCLNSNESYGVVPTTGSTYTWNITAGSGGAGSITNGAAPNNLISINWTSPGTCTLTVTEFNSNGCSRVINSILITVAVLPAAPGVTTPVNYCQNAIASALTASGTNLLWYTSETGGTGVSTAPTPSTSATGTTSYWVSQTNASGCEGPRSKIDVNINALPGAPVVTTPITYCQNSTAIALTATGTGLIWYTSANGGMGSSTAPIPSTSTVGSTSYWVSQTNGNGCEGPRAQIDVTINALPTAPGVTSPVTYCQDVTAIALTATGTSLLWYTSAAGGTGSLIAPIPSTATVGSTSYWVSQTNGTGCEGPRSQITVTVNALPIAPIVTTPVNYCQNAIANALTANGTSLLWYSSAIGGTGSSTAPIPSTSAVGTTSYWVSQMNGNSCEGPRSQINVTINALPVAPIVTTPVTYCQNVTSNALTATGTNLLWYTIATGGTGSSTAPIPSTATIGTTSYWVSQTNGNSCEGSRAQIDVTINALPVAPIVTSPVTYCQNAISNALTATGTGLLWYTTATGGTGSSTAPIPSTASVGSTSYWVSQTNGNACEGPRAQIDVTINALPLAPIVTTPVTYCQNVTSSALTANGTNLLWYTIATGGTGSSTAPIPSTSTVGSTSYWVSQTNGNSCEGPRSQITVTINALPAAPGVTSPVTYCQNATSSALTATGTGLLWYTSALGGIGSSTAPIPSTASVGSTSYWVSQTNVSGCEGPRSQIEVTINALPAAPIVTTPVTYCQNAAASALTATGTGLLWYTSATGGTGSSIAPVPSTAAGGTTSYWVSQTNGNGCEGPRTQIEVIVNALPIANISYSGSPYCATSTASVTQTGQTGGTYSSSTGLAINSSSGTIDLATSTPGSYTVTYSFTNGTCSNSVTTTVTINALPSATISYSGSPYCATGTAFVTQTGQTGGAYSSTSGLVINASTGVIDLAASTVGTYTITYSFGNGSCSNTTTTTVIIRALPPTSPIYHN